MPGLISNEAKQMLQKLDLFHTPNYANLDEPVPAKPGQEGLTPSLRKSMNMTKGRHTVTMNELPPEA